MTTEIEAPFEEPWQARAFALVVALHERGLFTWPEWTATLAAEIKADPGRPYYDAWLAALQSLALARSGLTQADVDALQARWLDAAAHTPHGQPITVSAAGS